MQIFLSWSGERSRLIAEAIRGWLPKVIQSVSPWMSEEDIGAGARWLTEVSASLNRSKVGLILITPENQHNPWLLFESGALSKTMDQTCVCPLVFEMTPGQLTGPLTQFQANPLNRDGVGKVLATINKGLDDRKLNAHELDEILDVWWPKLEERLNALPSAPTPAVTRSVGDQLEELLSIGREQLRRENLRLEASRERDEKLDGMLEHFENFGSGIASMQSKAHQMLSKMAMGMDSAVDGLLSDGGGIHSIEHVSEALKGVVESMAPSSAQFESMQKLTAELEELQRRDKQRTLEMLQNRVDIQRDGGA